MVSRWGCMTFSEAIRSKLLVQQRLAGTYRTYHEIGRLSGSLLWGSSCRPAPVAPSLTKNNRLANTALAALGGPSALRPAHNILKPRPSKGAATASNLMRHDVQQDQSLSWAGDEDALPSCTISRDPDMSGGMWLTGDTSIDSLLPVRLHRFLCK